MKIKQLTPDVKITVEQFAEVRFEIARLEKRQATLREKILIYADREDCALKFNADLLATVSLIAGRRGTDAKLLEVKFPEAFAATVKVGAPYLQIEIETKPGVIIPVDFAA